MMIKLSWDLCKQGSLFNAMVKKTYRFGKKEENKAKKKQTNKTPVKEILKEKKKRTKLIIILSHLIK